MIEEVLGMLYEYQCSCGFLSEVEHSMAENPTIVCPKCRNQMKKVISGGTGFVLKGPDWPGKEIKSGVKHKAK